MRSTYYINSIFLDKLKTASADLNISKDDIISILLSRVINKNKFRVKLYETVKYQDSYPDIDWKKDHVQFDPVMYEKAQDLRRNFKFSVSWFISFAIINYLDEIVKNLTESKNKNLLDNYDRNFVYIARMFGRIQGFITILGLPDRKYLEQLLIL